MPNIKNDNVSIPNIVKFLQGSTTNPMRVMSYCHNDRWFPVENIYKASELPEFGNAFSIEARVDNPDSDLVKHFSDYEKSPTDRIKIKLVPRTGLSVDLHGYIMQFFCGIYQEHFHEMHIGILVESTEIEELYPPGITNPSIDETKLPPNMSKVP